MWMDGNNKIHAILHYKELRPVQALDFTVKH